MANSNPAARAGSTLRVPGREDAESARGADSASRARESDKMTRKGYAGARAARPVRDAGGTNPMPGETEKSIEAQGWRLPEVGKPTGNWVQTVRSGNLLFISGKFPKEGGKLK